MKTLAAWIGYLLLAGRALAGDTIPEGIWTGVQTLPDARGVERRAVFTFSAVENIGSLDYRIGDGPKCRYVFRRGADAEIAPRPRAPTAAEPECAERMTVSGDPAGGLLTIGLGGDRIAVRMAERFRAIRSNERQTGTTEPFDILGLAPGLTAGKAREMLAKAGFDRRASRILSGPGWEEEHVTFARAPDGTGEDTIRIVFSPDIAGQDAARRIVHVERLWNIAGARSLAEVQHSVTVRYGIRLERVGDSYVGRLHLDRKGARIGLKAWRAGCAGANLQRIPFVKAFSDKARTEMISPGCGRALSVAARTYGARRAQVASLHVSILDPQAIRAAAWSKWSVSTAIDIREVLDRMAKPPNPLEL